MSTETLPLFSDASSVAAEPFDTISAAARAKLGRGPDWLWSDSRIVGDDYLVKGGVARRTRTGRLTWNGVQIDEVILTRADLDAAEAAHERETGRCFKCNGSGQQFALWKRESGIEYRPCARCGATGKAPTTAAR